MEVDGLDTVCAGLGFLSQDSALSYVKSEHCLENLKNLQRFLRRDHPTSRPVFKQLGKWNTIGRDLVPIILQYRDDPELIINAVKVVVFLTMPVDALSENVAQQLDYLLDFKACFLHNDAIAVIMTLLEEPLEHLESQTFSEDDWKVVQLVLTLMRNLVEIQDLSLQKVAVNESMRVISIRDKVLEHLFEENVMDLLLALAQHISGPTGLLRQDSILFLEIFHHVFWGQSPEKLATANNSKLLVKRQKKPSGLLRAITEQEKEQLKDLRLKDLSRHSAFSGSFVQVAEDGSKRMLKRNPFQSPIDAVFRGPQVKHGPVKRIACDRTPLTSGGRVLELLKTFADQVLLGSYNLVMQCVKDDISRERSWIQSADVALFFEVAKFFTAYQRCKINTKSDTRKETAVSTPEGHSDSLFQGQFCGPVASTMAQDMFVMVVSRWHTYSEAAKEANDWASLSIASSLFKEMVRMLDLVVLKDAKDKNNSEQQEVRVARILLYKVFYDQTEKGTFQFLLHLLKSFDIHKQPRSHLADLVETVHVVLRTIEFLTKEEGALRVLKKGRKWKKRKMESKNLENLHSDKDMTSDVNTASCDANIADEERRQNANNAVNMRSEDSAPQIENLSAEHPSPEDPETNCGDKQRDMANDRSVAEEHIHMTAKPERDSEDDSGNEGAACNVEVSLNVQRCAAMFADNTVIRNYCWLLSFFTTNTVAINHYIICMLQRICKDHSLEPMLYQLSLFQIFYEILSNRKASKLEEHKRIYSFLTKLTQKFFKKLKVQPLLFLDALFWKTRQECHLITTDYKIHSLTKTFRKADKSFTKPSIADALGNDEAEGDPQVNQSEDGVKLHLTTEGSNGLQKTEKHRKRGKITQEQEAHLMELFEQHKDNPKCCQLLAQEIDPEGTTITAAHVRRRLKALNLSPLLQRRRIKKGAENQDNAGDGRKTKNEKRNKGKKKTSVEQDVDVASSDDETLTQLMERVRAGIKKSINPVGELDTAGADNSDDTLMHHIAKRKRARKQSEISSNIHPANLMVAELGSEELQTNRELENSLGEKSPHSSEMESEEMDFQESSMEDFVAFEDIDPSLEDDVEELKGDSTPLLPSLSSPASAGRRRRALFAVDDEET
ncbi:hypothetical protein GOP47_0005574 [Adiantum capillus-veneris]|uniref:Timeless N-terminal domain-containing protein n=1 Tax=Adiantum capillus-veneris TaxID=13818 RepID=A0A9D4ZP93_ADICA|nr:hypothetical protein GOP47_0005574 [Adiantum capillus-veneris]